MSEIDFKGEDDDLLLKEVDELHSLSLNLSSLPSIYNNIQWQKSKIKWLQEGDMNNKFFHGLMSNRKWCINIITLNVNGVHMEGCLMLALWYMIILQTISKLKFLCLSDSQQISFQASH